MRIELIRRPERSAAMGLLSPLIAIALTVVAGLIVFKMIGVDPFEALYVYFIEPLTADWSLEDLVVKAAPIILIAVGLAVCFQSNTWNIGAEGQLAMGAIFGSIPPIYFPDWHGPTILPLMLLLGVLGGMAYAAVPALLKIRFGANEILTSLMLVYVAQLVLDWLARGPWRDPAGHNFPDSRAFDDGQLLPVILGDSIRLNIVFVLIVVAAGWFLIRRTITGFQIATLGQAPRAGAFAGFSQARMTLIAFLISGGLAGLAGICEVAGPIEKLRISVSPGYGFTAIIVAFLGRLNPVGILFAGFLLALSYLGGEGAQVALGVSDQIARVFQGMLLFFVLACDTFIFYRVRLVRRPAAQAPARALEASRGNA
jgi:general nucleoside transport system permease protein